MKRICCILLVFLMPCLMYAQKKNAAPVVPDTLYNQARSLMRQGDYKNAIARLDSCIKIIYGKKYIDHQLGYMALGTKGKCYLDQEQYAQAEICFNQAIDSLLLRRDTNKSNDASNWASYVNNIAVCQERMHRDAEAADSYRQAMRIYERVKGKESRQYLSPMTGLCGLYVKARNYAVAKPMACEALDLKGQLIGTRSAEYALSELHLGHCLYAEDSVSAALELERHAGMVLAEAGENYTSDYITSLNDQCVFLQRMGKLHEALAMSDSVIVVIELAYGSEHPEYAAAMNNSASISNKLGRSKDAFETQKETLLAMENTYGKNSQQYVSGLSNYAAYLYDMGNSQEALRYTDEAIGILKGLSNKDEDVYAQLIDNAAIYHQNLGELDEAERLVNEALRIKASTVGTQHSKYIQTLCNKSALLAKKGDYIGALTLSDQALGLYEKAYGTKLVPEYLRTLKDIASCYFDLGNFSEGQGYLTEAVELSEKIYGRRSSRYAQDLNELIVYYSQNGQLDRAEALCDEALATLEEDLGKDHPGYLRMLGTALGVYYRAGKYEKGIELGSEVLAMEAEKVANDPGYRPPLSNRIDIPFSISRCYSMQGEFAVADSLLQIAMKNVEQVYGRQHPLNFTMQRQHLNNVMRTNDPQRVELCRRTSAIANNYLRHTFQHLTAQERTELWNGNYQSWYSNDLPQHAYYIASDSINSTLYDGLLLSKGLLLNSEIEMTKLIGESGDPQLIALYGKLKTMQAQLNSQLEKPVRARYLDCDSMRREVRKVEQQLMSRSTAYGDYTRNLAIEWKSVRDRLDSASAAIEFLVCPLDHDSVMYVALVLKNGFESPRMVPLFEADHLKPLAGMDEKEKIAFCYYNNNFSKLVWGPLMNELGPEVKRIYFSPAGELYNISIEYMPSPKGNSLMCDDYQMYRLSSTRQLVSMDTARHRVENAVLYGGIRYDVNAKVSEGSLLADASVKRGGGINYLPGTLREVQDIYKVLAEDGVRVSLDSGAYASESKFKKLSGRKINMLHIATHGFYWSESQAMALAEAGVLSVNQDDQRASEDKALTRSGLLFAGVSSSFEGINTGADDGILTAKEISMLDLRGLDLLVLSACQTGLGEVMGDGVFGLQRGFKKAGAGAMLMSLWEVDDEATRMLMTQFYHNMLAGMDKHTALHMAQMYLRNYGAVAASGESSRGVGKDLTKKKKNQAQGTEAAQPEPEATPEIVDYSNPYYWSGFILLDGVN